MDIGRDWNSDRVGFHPRTSPSLGESEEMRVSNGPVRIWSGVKYFPLVNYESLKDQYENKFYYLFILHKNF